MCLSGVLLAAPPASAGSLTVRALQRAGESLVGAVITLDAETLQLSAGTPVKASVDQLNLAFVPDVLIIPVGSSVQFPNSDAVSHQVYSFSDARRFQLPLYRGKPYPPVVFDQPGVVTLGCNIHDNMLAYVIVTAAPFFGRTDARGEWSAANVPAGRYRLRLWHPSLNEPHDVERMVQVGADKDHFELQLTKSLHPAPLKGRPHSWDY